MIIRLTKSFNPRPLTSGRRKYWKKSTSGSRFQSTPAHERATSVEAGNSAMNRFNPRPLTSGRRADFLQRHFHCQFQSTPAHERATHQKHYDEQPGRVSIHARSRAGDGRLCDSGNRARRFNPRPLTSGRPNTLGQCVFMLKFQSTPAHERATPIISHPLRPIFVSIHARSRAGDRPIRRDAGPLLVSIHARSRAGDGGRGGRRGGDASFNPRPLTSGRLLSVIDAAGDAQFQSTPAHERATLSAVDPGQENQFQSTPAHERATRIIRVEYAGMEVSIHARSRAGDTRPPDRRIS